MEIWKATSRWKKCLSGRGRCPWCLMGCCFFAVSTKCLWRRVSCPKGRCCVVVFSSLAQLVFVTKYSVLRRSRTLGSTDSPLCSPPSAPSICVGNVETLLPLVVFRVSLERRSNGVPHAPDARLDTILSPRQFMWVLLKQGNTSQPPQDSSCHWRRTSPGSRFRFVCRSGCSLHME